MNKINLAEKYASFDETWSPRIIGETNGQLVKIAKARGEFVWHSHDNEDELFLVIKGRLVIEFREHHVELGPGEMCIVPKGVEHKPMADEETWILLIEPASTEHTGRTQSAITVAKEDQHWI
ncbi:MAG TPA: cupin domain-containing protein [Gammaproteobacteria bacterium]|nr:cupin domain-containing protein [Gammaproteobacteria bacterium]